MLDCPIVQEFARISAPLNNNLKKDELRTFESIRQKKNDALATLQDNLISAQVPPIPSTKRQLTRETDALDKQVGCTLIHEHPVGTKSNSGTGQER